MQPTETKPLRILLVGDYSNMHSQLARTLRDMGHHVTLMSDGCGFMDTQRSIDITRRKGIVGGAWLAARCYGPLHKFMRGNDIVALQDTHFMPLRTKRLRYFFERLRGENGAVFLTAASTDSYYVKECLNHDSSLHYNEFRVGNNLTEFSLSNKEWLDGWQCDELTAYNDYIYQHVDGVVTALYEYQLATLRNLPPEKVEYGGIPIDTESLKPYAIPGNPDCVNIFLGRHKRRMLEKGTDILEQAARVVCDRHPGKVHLEIVEDRPYAEYINLMAKSHIVLDQIYSYSPATNAMIAMSRGLAAASGGEPEFYDFIGERENRPIINVTPDLDRTIEILDGVASAPEKLKARGEASRRFVVRHNEATVVAERFLNFWRRRLASK